MPTWIKSLLRSLIYIYAFSALAVVYVKGYVLHLPISMWAALGSAARWYGALGWVRLVPAPDGSKRKPTPAALGLLLTALVLIFIVQAEATYRGVEIPRMVSKTQLEEIKARRGANAPVVQSAPKNDAQATP